MHDKRACAQKVGGKTGCVTQGWWTIWLVEKRGAWQKEGWCTKGWWKNGVREKVGAKTGCVTNVWWINRVRDKRLVHKRVVEKQGA